MPFLPASRIGDPTPDAVVHALRDPELVSVAPAPYLPPAAPPKPHVAAPVVFDARALVDATKRKVDRPVYGPIPRGTPESQAAVEAARAKMRRKRRRSKVLGWVMAVVFFAVVAAVGYALYNMYKDDQAEERAA